MSTIENPLVVRYSELNLSILNESEKIEETAPFQTIALILEKLGDQSIERNRRHLAKIYPYLENFSQRKSISKSRKSLSLQDRLAAAQIILTANTVILRETNSVDIRNDDELNVVSKFADIFDQEICAAANPYKPSIGLEIEAESRNHFVLKQVYSAIAVVREIFNQKYNGDFPEEYWKMICETLKKLNPEYKDVFSTVSDSLGGTFAEGEKLFNEIFNWNNLSNNFVLNHLPSTVLGALPVFYSSSFAETVFVEDRILDSVETALLPSATVNLQIAELVSLIQMDGIEFFGLHFTLSDILLNRENPEFMDLLLIIARADLLPENVFEKIVKRLSDDTDLVFSEIWLHEIGRKGYYSTFSHSYEDKYHFPFHGVRKKKKTIGTSPILNYRRKNKKASQRGVEVRGILGFYKDELDVCKKIISFYQLAAVGILAHQKPLSERDDTEKFLANLYIKFINKAKQIFIQDNLVSKGTDKQCLILDNPCDYSTPIKNASSYPTRYERVLTKSVIQAKKNEQTFTRELQQLIGEFEIKIQKVMSRVEEGFA